MKKSEINKNEIEMEEVAFQNNSTILIWQNVINKSYPLHWHAAMEIIIPIENGYSVTTPTDSYCLQTEDIIILPPGEIHALEAPPEGKRYIYLIDISFLSNIKGFSTLLSLLTKPLHITASTHGIYHKNLLQHFLFIANTYFQEAEYSDLHIYSVLLQIFVEIGTYRTEEELFFPSSRKDKKTEYLQKINPVLDYIDNHSAENIMVDDMAKLSGFSKYHFLRIFAEYTGHTFASYINLKRIKNAELLLQNNELAITQIAMQSGFSSICTFNRVFKQFKNCTPGEYRSLYHSFPK